MHRNTWFDDAWIERTVTREFVCSHLLPGEIPRLDEPLAFGDSLTDHTYWDWILDKTRRLLLILVDLGVPDQIFGVIDDSWEDDDLPIPLDQVDRLVLTPEPDSKMERKFYQRQFAYLLRPLQRDQHVDYADDELVPLDVVERRPTGAGGPGSPGYDMVELPARPGHVFCRRRVPLGPEAGCLSRDEFASEMASARDLWCEHVMSYEASYTHQGYGYVLLSPAPEYRMSSYLTSTLSPIKSLKKLARRRMVLDWIHCMVDSLCFIHSRGRSLGNIKPSTISFTRDHHVVLPDCLGLGHGHAANESHSFDKESYDYAAPEQWARPGARCRTLSMPAPNTAPHKPHLAADRRGCGGAAAAAISSTSSAQAADIFALGCIILELLGHGLLKRSTGAFAAFRGAKHKSPGRGGAVLDSSFHRNLGQVEAWTAQLAKAADKKAGGDDDGGRVFAAVGPLLRVAGEMLALHPGDRPAAATVRTWVSRILTEAAGVAEPHCAVGRDPAAPAGGPLLLDGASSGASMRSSTHSSSGALAMTASWPSSSFLDVDDDDGGGGGGGGGEDDGVGPMVCMSPSASPPSSSSQSGGGGGGGGGGFFKLARRVPRRRGTDEGFFRRSRGAEAAAAPGDHRWELDGGLTAVQNLRLSP